MAKVSKFKNLIILIILLLVVLLSYSYKIQSINKVAQNNINAYDYAHDVYTDANGTKYLPIRYEDADKSITKSEIESNFNDFGIQVKSVSTDNIGTGTKIETKYATYVVLIYRRR